MAEKLTADLQFLNLENQWKEYAMLDRAQALADALEAARQRWAECQDRLAKIEQRLIDITGETCGIDDNIGVLEACKAERDKWKADSDRKRLFITECQQIIGTHDCLKVAVNRLMSERDALREELGKAEQTSKNWVDRAYEQLWKREHALHERDEARADYETTKAFYEDERRQLDEMRQRAEAAEQREARLRAVLKEGKSK